MFFCYYFHSVDYFMQVHPQKPRCWNTASSPSLSLTSSFSFSKRAASYDTHWVRKTMKP